jgi:hopanoid biosynthesis associated protein HpnK
VRRLIVNADDFGLTGGINRAIGEAHSQGIVTSATLMANSSAFEDAVNLTRELPQISIGCHVVLVDGAPLLNPLQVRSLIAPKMAQPGRFHSSLARFAARALTGRLDESQIEAEAVAQIRKLQAAGIRVSHLDTHKHTHLFPTVARAILRAARACGIRAVRNPFSPRTALSRGLLRTAPRLWKRSLQVRVLDQLRDRFLRLVADADMITTDGSLGIVAAGVLDLALFEREITLMPPGTWELVCHPGYSDSDLDRVRTRLRDSRIQELKLLVSSEARAILNRQSIDLLSYRDLAAGLKPPPAVGSAVPKWRWGGT